MKYSMISLGFIFILGCATGPSSQIDNVKILNGVKKGFQDVKKIDTVYSSGIKASSNLRNLRARVSCKEYGDVDNKNWRRMLEIGYSCIKKKNWSALSVVANKLSHNHLKAPWGPYYRSIIAEQEGDLTRAIWMVDLALKKAPQNTIIIFQKARVLWLAKNESMAYEMMKKVVKLDPKNYDALFFLGNIHYRDRDFKEALKFYKKIFKYNHKDAGYRAAMGESNFYLGNYQESIKHYKAAALRSKLNASLFYKLGLSYKNLKNWSNAKVYLEKAIVQRRKGRSLASLSDEKIRADLKIVEAKIRENKRGKNEKTK